MVDDSLSMRSKTNANAREQPPNARMTATPATVSPYALNRGDLVTLSSRLSSLAIRVYWRPYHQYMVLITAKAIKNAGVTKAIEIIVVPTFKPYMSDRPKLSGRDESIASKSLPNL